MIPCFVCGRDIGGGWSIGYPPAPDSQKLGLCREHDRPERRESVQRAWRDLICKHITESNLNAAFRAGDLPRLLSIYFTGGGSVSLPCSALSLPEGNTLKVLTPGGETIYFPLSQVRNYALSPATSPNRPEAEAPQTVLEASEAPDPADPKTDATRPLRAAPPMLPPGPHGRES